LTIISTQADIITRIVRQLLNLARPFQLHRAPLGLAHLLADAAEAIEAEAAKNSVAIRFGRIDHLQIDGDRELLRQVFMNLLVNALHAMPAGGSLIIEADDAEVVKDNHRFVAVRVADNGSGIAPEHLPHIFDPFFTTKDVGKGTGLGLTVTRRILEEHGGWIEAAPGADGGTVFIVYLPQAAETSHH
jgi:signal transduction histidine kinase